MPRPSKFSAKPRTVSAGAARTLAARLVAGIRADLVSLQERLVLLERALLGKATAAPTSDELAASGYRFTQRGVQLQRARLGLSAEQFGKLLGVSSQAIYNWEHGVSRPRDRHVRQLAILRKAKIREVRARLLSLEAASKQPRR